MPVTSRVSILRAAGSPPLEGYEKYLIESSLAKAGIDSTEVHFTTTHSGFVEELNSLSNLQIIMTMGEKPLQLVTGKYGIDKWHLSPLDTIDSIHCPKCMPTFDYHRFNRQYDYRFFFFVACGKLATGMMDGPWPRKKRIEHINPEPETINSLLTGKDILSVDIETSMGTINTLGLAWSPNEAIAIRIDPGRFEPHREFQFWKTIARYMENPNIKKVLQNNLYEGMYFARYGIRLRGIWHDTMWAQKMLYPEFKQGLDMVGRLYTNEIYWKEDGKDWNNINNWIEHLRYNISDTINTLEAAFKQRKELQERGMLALYSNYMIKLAEPLLEMCTTGLTIDTSILNTLNAETIAEIESVKQGLSQPINHRSSLQKKNLFKSKKYKLPRKTNTKGDKVESTDELSLKKLRLKYPEDQDLEILLRLSKLEKFKSSYLDFDYHDDNIVRYTIKGSGTETLRFSSGTDAWDMGFNAQTIPKKAKKIFKPPADHKFVQIDLSKAESYYVAYKAKELNLIDMLSRGEDIHSYVASHIYGVPMEQIIEEAKTGNNKKRQVGKKSGHGANYNMGPLTFQDSCLKEDLIISKAEATQVLETYHRLFPGIRRWHTDVENQVKSKGYLENPLGFRRYFYGRRNSATFREAYAFEPQSTIPMIMNHLLLYMLEKRETGLIDFNIHLQVHDSLVFSVVPNQIHKFVELCQNIKAWHPKIVFPAGEMWIPIDIEVGDNLKDLEGYSSEQAY